MKTEDDQTLVVRCRNGDRAAFGALVVRYQKPVYNVALRMLRDPEDARDVTQTTFLKAFARLEDFDPRFKFFSWLYRIAINESINLGQRRPVFEALDETLEESAPGPDQVHGHSQLAATIESTLQRLSHDQRAVIVLRHFLECSYEDMSAVLEIPIKTVKSRLFEARKQLRQKLEHQIDANLFASRG